MKIISLNTWGAKVGAPFYEFIHKYRDVDIFCLQEVYENAHDLMHSTYPTVNHNLFSDLQKHLPEHNAYFRPVLHGVYGVALFIKKDIQVIEEGEIQIHKGFLSPGINGHHDRNMQWAKVEKDGKSLTIMNVHGLWNGKGKDDVPERIAQSTRVRAFMDSIHGPKILSGDFNLNPDTESVRILEKGMRNLVTEYKVTSTRTSLYNKPGPFADYIFTTPDIEVKHFEVLPEEVSDHAALLLEI